MKLCFLADGESIHTLRWCSYFLEQGCDIHLISFKNVSIRGVHVHFVNAGKINVDGGNWKVLLNVFRVRKLLKKIRPDILHAHYATAYGIVGAVSGYHPYILTAYGSDVLVSAKNNKVYRFLVRFAMKKATLVTAMADHMRDEIISMGIKEDKVKTLVFGIDPKVFNRTNRRLPDNKFVISSTRNFEPVYNLNLLMQALEIIKDKIPELYVHLIGDGQERSMLEERIREMELSEKVKFHGRVSQKTIAETLNATHVFISTSFSDGNNVSLNEAMACGCVNLASDIPANRSWIKDGVNGFLVPVDDPVYLAEKILEIYKHYNEIQNKALSFNDQLIHEKAIWSKNMNWMKMKYEELMQSRN